MGKERKCKPVTYKKVFKKIYFDLSSPGGFSGVRQMYLEAKKHLNCKITQPMVENWLQSVPAYTLHKPIRKKFPRLPVIVAGPQQQMQADLIDFQSLSRFNDGYRYLLVVVDCFSRKAWVEPLKNKSGLEVAGALKILFDRCGLIPRSLQTDLGKEFYNQNVDGFLRTKNVKLFSTNNAEIKAGQVERLNRTISTKLFRYFTHAQSRRWINIFNS